MAAGAIDTDLLSRARAGDRIAFSALIEENRSRLWAVCLRTTGRHADAEDALQDTLIAIWQNLDSFRGDSGFSTWCYRIASNAALGVIRKRKPTVEPPDDLPDDKRDFVDDIADRDRVQKALDAIPEAFRNALILREYGQLTYDEIAEHEGILVQTVKTRINRARAAVLAELQRNGPVEAGRLPSRPTS